MTHGRPRGQQIPRAPAPGQPRETRAGGAALLLLGLLFLQGLVFIGYASQTSDEGAHLAAGYSYLETLDFRLNPEHPPLIKELAALPLLMLRLQFPWGPLWDRADEWTIGQRFVHENNVPNDTILLLARLPILALSLALGWALFHWGRRLFGPRAALLALALYVLDPNVVAHSCLVTTDLGVTLFIFLSVYALWSWSGRPTPARLLLVGLAVGGAFASKFTALWLLPILALLALALFLKRTPLPERPWSAGGGSGAETAIESRTASRRLASLTLAGLLVAAVALLVVAASYGVVGLPAFLLGLERNQHHSAIGHTAYLAGRLSETGWWYYFLFAYLIKTPIGTLVLILMSLVALARGTRRGVLDEMFLWIPILATLGITCLWKVNIGLRHLLPIYPFLYLSAGRIAAPAAAGV
ncbi:MAG TPA: glycosyltransferase family 39 protein, partial [Candidatus Polarisedimenticolia bacterium]|nr:glycosyltransferase family 39 protein [Candidatus Polarisedimenticolia bacterium]